MMRLRELQLFGFKSFPEKTRLVFAPGTTAIVGPNGCGKSNILDALRWVMGEQNFAALRCAKNDDLIFAGTTEHPGLGYTEVRLVLETDAGRPDLPAEIEIRRRYYKSGESEYAMNRQPVRLRDIQDLFFNLGAGAQAYSIFDQGLIKEIIAGRIRPMFEEAAAIAKYRDRKTEVEHKLERTAADLTRLEDIIAERERVVRALRRQARRLESYQKIKTEHDKLKLIQLKRQLDELDARGRVLAGEEAAAAETEKKLVVQAESLEQELRAVRSRLKGERARWENLVSADQTQRAERARLEAALAGGAERLRLLEAEAERARLAHDPLAVRLGETTAKRSACEAQLGALLATVGALKDGLHQAQARNRDQEAELVHQRQVQAERQRSQEADFARRAALEREILECRARASELDDEHARRRAELGDQQAQLGALDASFAAREAALAAAQEAFQSAAEERERTRQELKSIQESLGRQRAAQLDARTRLTGARSRLEVLRPALAGEQRAELAARLGERLRGPVADFLDIEPGMARAADAVLYAVLDFFILAGPAAVPDLDRERRWGFLVETELAGPPPDLPTGPGITGPLSGFVRVRPGAPSLLRRLIAETVVVESLATAAELAAQHRELSFVTADGTALFAGGLLLLEGTGTGRLTLEERVRELQATAADLTTDLARLDAEVPALETRQAELERTAQTQEQQLLALIRERAAAEEKLAAARRQAEEGHGAERRGRDELARNRQQAEELAARAAARAAEHEAVSAALAASSDEYNRAADELTRQEQELKTFLESLNGQLLQLATLEEQKRALETEIAYLVAAENEQQTGLGTLRQVLADAETGRAAWTAARPGIEAELARLTGTGAPETDRDFDALRRLDEEEDRLENAQEKVQSELAQARQQVLDLRLRRFELDKGREVLIAEARSSYAADLVAFAFEPVENLDERLATLVARLNLISLVNPLAISEHQREAKELEELVRQRQDVLDARHNLTTTIGEIDQLVRDQFLTTFEQVRSQFQLIFSRLFPDGAGDLRLHDPANLWESEIDIIARPKGKNPRRLQQLSDGEKTLLAIALLFAFYFVRPAPFCFIDEVDAFLDDVNVVKFAVFLQEIAVRTQIVIITHNRSTIEHADTLFGVTMPLPGISRLVSVRLADLEEALQRAAGAEPAPA